jgi:hypothetical protein
MYFINLSTRLILISVFLFLFPPNAVSVVKKSVFCGNEMKSGKSIPVTILRLEDGSQIPIIFWKSTFFDSLGKKPKIRCDEASRKLNEYPYKTWPKYFRTDTYKGQVVLCAVTNTKQYCEESDIITYFPPEVNKREALNALLDLSLNQRSKSIYLSNGVLFFNNKEYFIDIEALIKNKSNASD